MSNKSITTTLFVRSLELSVNLGWRLPERGQEQAVLLDLEIRFPTPPQACENDNLDDTVCYATLINHIRANLENKHYHLVEHLSADIYAMVKPKLPPQSRLLVNLTKYPKIGGLTGGVCFSYGEV